MMSDEADTVGWACLCVCVVWCITLGCCQHPPLAAQHHAVCRLKRRRIHARWHPILTLPPSHSWSVMHHLNQQFMSQHFCAFIQKRDYIVFVFLISECIWMVWFRVSNGLKKKTFYLYMESIYIWIEIVVLNGNTLFILVLNKLP